LRGHIIYTIRISSDCWTADIHEIYITKLEYKNYLSAPDFPATIHEAFSEFLLDLNLLSYLVYSWNSVKSTTQKKKE
jgi:hypothetical protein